MKEVRKRTRKSDSMVQVHTPVSVQNNIKYLCEFAEEEMADVSVQLSNHTARTLNLCRIFSRLERRVG